MPISFRYYSSINYDFPFCTFIKDFSNMELEEMKFEKAENLPELIKGFSDKDKLFLTDICYFFVITQITNEIILLKKIQHLLRPSTLKQIKLSFQEFISRIQLPILKSNKLKFQLLNEEEINIKEQAEMIAYFNARK